MTGTIVRIDYLIEMVTPAEFLFLFLEPAPLPGSYEEAHFLAGGRVLSANV